jgi:hypothetical protein
MCQGNCYIYYKCYFIFSIDEHYYYYYYYGCCLLCRTDVFVLFRYVGLHFNKGFIFVASESPSRNVCSMCKKAFSGGYEFLKCCEPSAFRFYLSVLQPSDKEHFFTILGTSVYL